MRDKILIELISGGFVEPDIIKLEALNLKFNGNNFAVAAVFFDRVQSQDLDRHIDLINDKLKELLKNYEELISSIVYKGAIVLILNCLDTEKVVHKIYEDIGIISEESITIGIGGIFQGCSNINLSYKEAIMCIEMRNILDLHKIIHIENVRNNENSHRSILKKIKEYISKNSFNEDISLNQIAEEVHITPTYVSTLFKKYMEINFNDYLTNIRIIKAKELLINTDMKTYEVSEKVGYSNPQYFSVLFKKHTGCSPIEYRQTKK